MAKPHPNSDKGIDPTSQDISASATAPSTIRALPFPLPNCSPDPPQPSSPIGSPRLGASPVPTYANVAAAPPPQRSKIGQPNSATHPSRSQHLSLPMYRRSHQPLDSPLVAIPRSHSAFAVLVHIQGHPATHEELIDFLHRSIPGIESLGFIHRGRTIELGFLTAQHVNIALCTPLVLHKLMLTKSRAYRPKQDVLAVTVQALPTFSKDETYTEVGRVFKPYGDLLDVQFSYYAGTGIRLNTCTIFLERPPLSSSSQCPPLPRSLLVFEAPCNLFWKGSEEGPEEFCRYCRRDGHSKQECPKLKDKNTPHSSGPKPTPTPSQAPPSRSSPTTLLSPTSLPS